MKTHIHYISQNLKGRTGTLKRLLAITIFCFWLTAFIFTQESFAGLTIDISASDLNAENAVEVYQGGSLLFTCTGTNGSCSDPFLDGIVQLVAIADSANRWNFVKWETGATSNTIDINVPLSPTMLDFKAYFNNAPVAVDDSTSTNEDTPVTVNVVSNDTDAENDPLTVSAVTQGTNGTVTFAAGSVTYTPNANYNGTDSFAYTANDGTADSNVATVTIGVAAVNDAPVAVDDSTSTNEDTPVTVNVVSNDTDAENDPLTVSAVTQGTNGTVTFAAGSVTYTPNANYNGTDSFTYTANDGTADSNVATVTIGVAAVNDAPVAVDDSTSTNEDTPVTVNVVSNDTDAENDPLTVSAVTQGTNGTVTFAAGSVTYTPNANYNGTDSFTYTANDGTADSNVATVTIGVAAVNDAPVAVDDSTSTNEDTPVTVNVVSNDTDAENDPLTVSAVTQGTNGTVTFAAGSVTYTPNANYNGTDSFTYTANDGTADSNVATVTIGVAAVNDAPVAVDDSTSTNEDTPVTVNVVSNDTDAENDPLTVSAVTQGTNGTVTFAAGSVTYTPNANYNGTDSFTYTANDGTADSNVATVTIGVAAVNDAPVAVDDSTSTNEDTPVTVNVVSNDTDAENDPLTVSAVTQGTNGTVTFAAGSVTYTPNANYNGTDSFTYTANDGTADSNVATVTIGVAAVNDAPVAVDDSTSTNEDTPVTVNVVSNDTDAENDPLTVSAVTQGTNGTVTFAAGSVTYTPNANYNGTDSFTYTANDGTADSNVATVTISVAAVNDAPVAVDDSYEHQ